MTSRRQHSVREAKHNRAVGHGTNVQYRSEEALPWELVREEKFVPLVSSGSMGLIGEWYLKESAGLGAWLLSLEEWEVERLRAADDGCSEIRQIQLALRLRMPVQQIRGRKYSFP